MQLLQKRVHPETQRAEMTHAAKQTSFHSHFFTSLPGDFLDVKLHGSNFTPFYDDKTSSLNKSWTNITSVNFK